MLDLSHLNEEQKQAVIHGNGPLLIVAGAGTGKTTVITQRVAWLIDQKLAKPDEILCLTFTEKAAGEMEERIDRALPYGYVDLWVLTFHGFAERLLRQYSVQIGLPSDFKIVDETTAWMIVYQNFDRFALNHYKPLGNPAKFIPDLLSHFSRLKDEGITPEQYLDYVQELELDSDHPEFLKFGELIASPKKTTKKKAATESEPDAKELWTQEISRKRELASAYAVYQTLLQENHALDFGDLLLYVKQLLNTRPMVLEELRRKFKYLLVDEFQDTNWVQYDIVKTLAHPHNNITVVGDDDQSIYKFRGASLSNILGFKHDFPDTSHVVLTQNYRSAQDILDLAYNFIQHNNPNRLESAPSGLPALNKKLTASNDSKGMIERIHRQSLQDEAGAVIEKMIDIRRQNETVQWGDFAILVRANSHADPFLQQLTLAEIPFTFLASQGLFSKPVILDVLSYFKVLDRYVESRALYRILILPTIDFANEDLMLLLHHSDKKGISLYESLKQAAALGVSENGISLASKVLSLIDKHSSLARTKSVSEVAMAFIDDFGLKSHYETLHPMDQQETYNLLNQFWKIMRQFEAEQEEKGVSQFLQFIDLVKRAGDRGELPVDVESGPDTVKIMTIHASKGLEFKYVFVVNFVDRRFPSTERKDPLPIPDVFINEQKEAALQTHLEEERRLCYVAITRAKQGLFLTSAEDYGGSAKKKPSRFLAELGFEPAGVLTSSAAGKVQWGQTLRVSYEAAKAKTMDYKPYLPKAFSFTQYKTFQTCPWQYRYAHILKIPRHGSHQRSFGQSLHLALQKFFNLLIVQRSAVQASMFAKPSEAPNTPSLEQLLQLFEESWIDEWYQNPQEQERYKKKGREILRNFYAAHQHEWPNTIATEQPFRIKVGDYVIRGSIDRVDQVGDKLHLFDYKSARAPKRDASIKKDQLILYHIAAEEVLQGKVEALSFYYLEDNVAKAFTATEKQQERLKEKLLTTFDALMKSDFAPTPSKEVCKHCDFKDICQYRLS